MKTVSKDSIIEIFVWLDDYLEKPSGGRGRKALLSESEVLAILTLSALTENHHRFSEVYAWVKRIYPGWFRLPAYQNFIIACHPRFTGDGQALKRLAGRLFAATLR